MGVAPKEDSWVASYNVVKVFSLEVSHYTVVDVECLNVIGLWKEEKEGTIDQTHTLTDHNVPDLG